MPIPKLAIAQRTTLVTLLCACPSVADSGTRDAFITQLTDTLRHGIARHAATRVDVTYIVQRCLAYADGLDALVAAVHGFEGDSLPMQDLLRWVRREANAIVPDGHGTPTGTTDADPSPLPSLTGTHPAVSGAIMAGNVTGQGIAPDNQPAPSCC